MARSKWKGPYVDTKLLKSTGNYKPNQTIYTQSRSSTIIPAFIGMIFKVHNGKIFYKLKVTEGMVGFKLGEFAPTRKFFSFKKSKK